MFDFGDAEPVVSAAWDIEATEHISAAEMAAKCRRFMVVLHWAPFLMADPLIA
jgi:hypothetical protein